MLSRLSPNVRRLLHQGMCVVLAVYLPVVVGCRKEKSPQEQKGQEQQTVPPLRERFPELEDLIVTFPPITELAPLWEESPPAFPPYVEIVVSFVQEGKARREVVGLDLPRIEQATLHTAPAKPVVAQLAPDQCEKGIAHLSVWIEGKLDAKPSFMLYGYEEAPPAGEVYDSGHYLAYNLEPPPQYSGPAAVELTTDTLRALLEHSDLFQGAPAVALTDAPTDPALIEQRILARYTLAPGDLQVVPLTLTASVRVVTDPAKAGEGTVLLSPSHSPVISVGITGGGDDLLVVARQPGRQVLSLTAKGMFETRLEFVVEGEGGSSVTAPPARARGVAVASPAEVPLPSGVQAGVLPSGGWSVQGGRLEGPLDDGPATVLLPLRDGSRELLRVYPAGPVPRGVTAATATTLGREVFGLGSTGAGVVAATAAEVRGVVGNLWTLPVDFTIAGVAAGADRLALLMRQDETLSTPPTVMLYTLRGGADPKALGSIPVSPYPVVMRWRGDELWVAHRDGTLLQAVPGTGGYVTRTVQGEPRKTTPYDITVGAGGELVVVTDGLMEVYEGWGRDTKLARAVPVDCFATRVAPLGPRRYVLGCTGAKRTGERFGVYNYQPAPGAHGLIVDVSGGQTATRPLAFGDPAGMVMLTVPWPGGVLLAYTSDTSGQQATEVAVYKDVSWVVLDEKGAVRHRGTAPALSPSPGWDAVPWQGRLYVLTGGSQVVTLSPAAP